MLHRLVKLNAISIVILALLVSSFFLGLSPPSLFLITWFTWMIWTVFSNFVIYKSHKEEQDPIKQFERKVSATLRKHHVTELPLEIEHCIRNLATNYYVVLAKQQFFTEQTDNIQKAYRLIYDKSVKYLNSAAAFLEQYDFVRTPASPYLQKLQQNSMDLTDKLQELSMNCFLINDQASEVDISIIDDLLQALQDIQDD